MVKSKVFRFFLCLAAAITCTLSFEAGAELKDVCTDIRPLKGIKYKANPSDHITTGPRVGGISLIYKRGQRLPSVRCLPVYDSNGTQLARMGKYEPNGNIFGARYYSGAGCAGRTRASKIAKQAFDNTGDRSGYISVGGKTCLQVTDLRRDQGSVR